MEILHGFTSSPTIRWRIAWLILLFAGYAHSSFAQLTAQYAPPGPPLIQYVDAETYGASDRNNDILQAPNGWLYVANDEGVLEFNGATWRLIPISNGTPAFGLAIDSSGTIYVGARDELGLLQPDSVGQLQYRSLVDNIPEKHRAFNSVHTLFATPEGVFFQADFFLFRWQGGRMHTWEAPYRYFRDYFANQNIYLISVNEGVLRVSGDSLITMIPFDALENDPILEMITVPDRGESRLLLLFLSTRLAWWDGQGQLMDMDLEPAAADYLLKHEVVDFLLLPDNRLAISTISGGIVFLTLEGKLDQIIDGEAGMPEGQAYRMCLDRQQGLWVISPNGLLRIALGAPLTFWGETNGLTGGVEEIFRIHDRLYVGSGGFGLFRQSVQPQENTFTNFSGILSISSGFRDMVRADRHLFVGTDRSLTKVFSNGRTSGSIQLPVQQLHSMQNQENFTLVGFSNGIGVVVEQRKDGESNFNLDAQFPGFQQDAYRFAEEPSGAFWVGSEFRGIYRFMVTDFGLMLDTAEIDSNPYLKDLIPEIRFYQEEAGVPRGKIQPFYYDDTLWIATEKGIRWFDEATEKFKQDQHPGVDTTYAIEQMISGPTNDVWLLAEKAGKWFILRRTPTDNTYRSIPTLARFTYGSPPTCLYPDPVYPEILWIGTKEGLYRYDAGIEVEEAASFSAFISQVNTAEVRVPLGGQLVLPFEQNSLTFQFGAPSMINPEKTVYQYRLLGLEEEWSDWSSTVQKEYSRLSEGRYEFQARARDIQGEVSEIAIYTFTILPPWYRSWWAYTLFCLISLAVIVASVLIYNRWRLRKLLAKNLELEQIVEIRTEEIQEKNVQLAESLDTLQATQQQLIMQEKMASLGQMTAGIAHEIQNPLNFIQNFSAVVTELAVEFGEDLKAYLESQSPEDLELLMETADGLRSNSQRIYSHGNRASQIVRGMIEHAQGTSQERHPTEVTTVVSETVQLALNGYQVKQPDFQCEVTETHDPHLPKVPLNRQDLQRVILNLVNNACYAMDKKAQEAGSDYQPTLQIRTQAEGGMLHIYLRDNGPGIPPELQEQIFTPFFTTKPTGQGNIGLGLSISYDILRQGYQGDLRFETEAGAYTEFIVSLPLGEG